MSSSGFWRVGDGITPRQLAHRDCERDRTDTNFGVNGRGLLSDYAKFDEATIASEESFGFE
jgi:hypothetical protein